MENAVQTRKWIGTYSGHKATFREVKRGIYLAISVTAPELTSLYVTEVYVIDPSDGIATFLGYEPAVCIHPGDMALVVSEARPNWAESWHHV